MHDERRNTAIVKPGADSVQAAIAVLQRGGLVAFPTETVYGLGADATSGAAVAGIYAAKQRPSFNPLIAHVASLQQAQIHGVLNADARKLAAAFWPGALTLVAPVTENCGVSMLARAGLDSLALRVPDDEVALALLRAFGKPLAAPSANLSGTVSPTSAAHVHAGLAGRIDMIIDGGPCLVGVESTIIACLDDRPVMLRPGGIARADIEKVLGKSLAAPAAAAGENGAEQLLAPGMLASHYAPRAAMRLDAKDAGTGEAVLDFAGQLASSATAGGLYADLSAAGNLAEAAANLFAMIRQLDDAGADHIAVAPVPGEGLGEAINDRLARAAA